MKESYETLKDLGYSWDGRELWNHEGFGLLLRWKRAMKPWWIWVTPEVEESCETMKDLGYSWGERELWNLEGFVLLLRWKRAMKPWWIWVTSEVEESCETMKDLGYSWGESFNIFGNYLHNQPSTTWWVLFEFLHVSPTLGHSHIYFY